MIFKVGNLTNYLQPFKASECCILPLAIVLCVLLANFYNLHQTLL